MLLTITTTRAPATDLGYLLHKHPAKLQTLELAFGRAHVFYPEVSEQRCSAALLIDVDPVQLARGKGFRGTSPLEPYVNDRPYASSSFVSVAIAHVFGSALAGRCKERPELAQVPLPLEARITCLPCRGGPEFLERLFAPLGYAVESTPLALDPEFPRWGNAPHRDVVLRGEVTLRDLLSHLYVLVPVLDDKKHYWVGEDEVDKLVRHGREWLASHPERERIAARYLKHRPNLRALATEALAALDVGGTDEAVAERDAQRDDSEAAFERPLRLNDQRIEAVVAAVRDARAERVLDLGCGEGRVLAALLQERGLREIVGVDVSLASLDRAEERLGVERMGELQRARLRLLHGSLVYRDRRLEGYDCALLVEVVEHVDPDRLPFLERNVFAYARPMTVVLTTPNAEYNARFANLAAGAFRHADHRFEWSRTELRAWADRVGGETGYSVSYADVGPVDAELGAPTQMAIFRRQDAQT